MNNESKSNESNSPNKKPLNNDKTNEYDTICLSGGGMKGFSFVGALDYLQNKSFINISKITNWVGTSAGSILSYLFTIGYSIQDIGDFILDFNFQALESDISIDGLLESHGLNNGIKIIILLSNFLKEKYNLEDINFIDHYKLTGKKLTIIGTNFSKACETVFNYETYPSMSVITAIRISCSVPVIFEPVLFDGDYYIDGGLINNFPLRYCNPDTTIGIYIKNGCCNNSINMFSLIYGSIGIISDAISLKDSKLGNYKIVQIDNFGQEFMNFELDRDKKLKIIKLGQTFAQKFINDLDSQNNLVSVAVSQNESDLKNSLDLVSDSDSVSVSQNDLDSVLVSQPEPLIDQINKSDNKPTEQINKIINEPDKSSAKFEEEDTDQNNKQKEIEPIESNIKTLIEKETQTDFS